MVPWIEHKLHFWLCLISAWPLIWLTITIFSSAIYKFLLEFRVSCLNGFASGWQMSCTVFGFTRSNWVATPFGLPHSCVLSPLLYILYTADVATVQASCVVMNAKLTLVHAYVCNCSAIYAGFPLGALHSLSACFVWLLGLLVFFKIWPCYALYDLQAYWI